MARFSVLETPAIFAAMLLEVDAGRGLELGRTRLNRMIDDGLVERFQNPDDKPNKGKIPYSYRLTIHGKAAALGGEWVEKSNELRKAEAEKQAEAEREAAAAAITAGAAAIEAAVEKLRSLGYTVIAPDVKAPEDVDAESFEGENNADASDETAPKAETDEGGENKADASDETAPEVKSPAVKPESKSARKPNQKAAA